MVSSRIIIIRIAVFGVMIFATFALSWYLFTRFFELTKDGGALGVREEVNNPRLDTKTLEGITEEFNKREMYTSDSQVTVNFPEKDPFYE